MANNDSELLNQERQRRKRINRMKTGIVMTIAIWMLVSLLAIIILLHIMDLYYCFIFQIEYHFLIRMNNYKKY